MNVISGRYLRPMILVGEIAVLIYLLLPPSLFSSFRCESFHSRENTGYSRGFLIDDQVIVLGTQADITTVIGTHDGGGNPVTPGLAGIRLNLIENCDLSYLNTRRNPDPQLAEQQRETLVMQLFEIQKQAGVAVDTTESVVSRINAARGDDLINPEFQIYADPNYLTSLLDSTTDTCYLPNPGGGGGGGRDFGDPGLLPLGDDTSRAFMNQWAFVGSRGINYTDSSEFTGREVQVGVFDTSPFRGPLPIRRIGIALPSPLWIITRNAIDTPKQDAAGPTLTSNHGLFVSGLIHRIAPKSRLELIRVLGDDGCGESYQIAKALHAYISRKSSWTGDLDETVVNLSLGIAMPNEEEQALKPKIAWNQLKSIDPISGLRILNSYSLKEAIDEANRKGAIIVAAAGNDSDRPKNRVIDMVFPAKYENVLGVAATNPEREFACYSNVGDVSAPGGEGGETTRTKPDRTTELISCGPRADSWDKNPGPNNGAACQDPANCAYGLISLGQIGNSPQYIYWAGTSFATPLVSGLAALAYEERSKDQAKCIIEKGAQHFGASTTEPNWGIINLTQSLSSAVITQCEKDHPGNE